DSATGVYTIVPDGVVSRQVWCDMDTDGGGWTLVGSTVYPFYDEGGGYHNELDTLNPNGYHTSVWNGLRDVTTGNSDIRFACRRTNATNMRVAPSFYNTVWYDEPPAFTYDDAFCSNEQAGRGAAPPPARRNNLTGDFLPAGDPWNAGYLESEDS